MGWVPEIGVFGTRNHMEMGFLRQVEQGYSSFSDKFLAYMMIFQSFAAPSDRSTFRNYQICPKLGGKMAKKVVQIASKPISP